MNTKRLLLSTGLCAAACAAVLATVIDRATFAAEHEPEKAIAVLHGTQGNENVHGTVTFTKQGDGVLVEAHVMGLKPGQHGFHVHQYGDASAPDGASAGGHFNPANHPHAAPDADQRHVGDLGNMEADDKGHAMYKRVDKKIALSGENSIIGRAVVVHAGTDDLKTQPTGDAGGRLALGIVGIASTEQK